MQVLRYCTLKPCSMSSALPRFTSFESRKITMASIVSMVLGRLGLRRERKLSAVVAMSAPAPGKPKYWVAPSRGLATGSGYILPPKLSEAGSSFDFIEPTGKANTTPAWGYRVGYHLKRFKLKNARHLIGVLKNGEALGLDVVL